MNAKLFLHFTGARAYTHMYIFKVFHNTSSSSRINFHFEDDLSHVTVLIACVIIAVVTNTAFHLLWKPIMVYCDFSYDSLYTTYVHHSKIIISFELVAFFFGKLTDDLGNIFFCPRRNIADTKTKTQCDCKIHWILNVNNLQIQYRIVKKVKIIHRLNVIETILHKMKNERIRLFSWLLLLFIILILNTFFHKKWLGIPQLKKALQVVPIIEVPILRIRTAVVVSLC
jgi:hypothetical protein